MPSEPKRDNKQVKSASKSKSCGDRARDQQRGKSEEKFCAQEIVSSFVWWMESIAGGGGGGGERLIFIFFLWIEIRPNEFHEILTRACVIVNFLSIFLVIKFRAKNEKSERGKRVCVCVGGRWRCHNNECWLTVSVWMWMAAYCYPSEPFIYRQINFRCSFH